MTLARAIVLLLLAAPRLCADEPFALRDGNRVVFFGDSITQAGQYVTDVEAFLLTRFPDRTFLILNHGISSETISGTSEPDHAPRRPDAHDRFARDVAAWRPDVLVACFGMNDGNYFPPDPGRFERYREGVRRLIARARDEAGASLVLLTPPPFDPYRRQVGDPVAKAFGYRFPAVNYDETLGLYADWLLTLREGRIPVIDLHSALNEHLRQRRKGEVSFFLAGDGVHPNETGHWLMAQAILLAWHAPAAASEVRVDAANLEVEAGEVGDLEREDGGLAFSWITPLPAPIPPECDDRSIRIARVADLLNRHRLTVEGLPEGRYRVLAGQEGVEPTLIVVTDAERLADGLDLTGFAQFPTVALSQEVLKRLRERNRAAYATWRERIAMGEAKPVEPTDAYRRETEAIRDLCRPKVIEVRIEPGD
jgi:lysophospholipase L1-like esterase